MKSSVVRRLAMMCLLAAPLMAQDAPRPAQIRAAAMEVMKAARYATLVTVGEGGQPQARIVDPLLVRDGPSIWIATNPLTRKVKEMRANPRVTLLFFNATGNEYVTVLGKAAAIVDSAQKARHWKAEWAPFYKEQSRGADFMLFEVKPFRLEISSSARGLKNDAKKWQPVILNLP